MKHLKSQHKLSANLSYYTIAGFTCVSLIASTLTPQKVVGQTPKAKGPQQVVNPAPVNYWMDVSTGSSASGGGMAGMLGGMMGGMAGRGASGGGTGGLFGGRDNWFGAAQSGSQGRFTDIAIFDRRQPGRITADQAIPSGLKLGASIPLLPPPPPAPLTKGERTPWQDREPDEGMPEMPRFQIKFYWGCGAQVRPGQPRVLDFSRDNITAWGQFMQGRAERDRGATSQSQSSFWPNSRDSRKHAGDGSLVGDHAVTGTGLPASMRFQLTSSQDFMAPMDLTTQGNKSGVINLTWRAIPTATAYFANATGFSSQQGQGDAPDQMTMVMWSAAEVPDPGGGLLGYLSNSNQDRFLRDKAILPASQTSCEIPNGIFAESMMVNIGAIAYGRELNLVHPARPSDPRTPWNQEWTARVRVKSQASAMLMDGMGGSRSGQSSRGSRNEAPSADPEVRARQEAEARRLECEAERTRRQNAGGSLGQAVGGWRGALAGRALGALAGRNSGSQTANCDPQPAGPAPAAPKGN